MKKQLIKHTVLTRKEVIEILREELPKLQGKYGVKRIILYGSFAKGTQKKKSDVDILVELRKPLGLKFLELAEKFEEMLGRNVDITTYDHYKRSLENPKYKHIVENIRNSVIHV